MKRLLSCEFNFDTVCVELKFSDGAQFASTDCPFRMSGAGSSVEAVWVLG